MAPPVLARLLVVVLLVVLVLVVLLLGSAEIREMVSVIVLLPLRLV